MQRDRGRLTVGVLGGMGPMATVEAFRRLTLATPAKRDQDHLHVIVDSDPSAPDRTLALLGQAPEPLPWLVSSAHRLVSAGAEIICMPCNTAHAYHRRLQDEVPVPIVHMIEAVVTAAAPPPSLYGLLATEGTVHAGLYQDAFQMRGRQLLLPSEPALAEVAEAIRLVKAGADPSVAVAHCLPALREMLTIGACGVILGCTEISLLTHELATYCPVLDALQVMVDRTARIAIRGQRIPQVGTLTPTPVIH